MIQVVKNIRIACNSAEKNGLEIVSAGTDNHLFVADVRPKGTDGSRIETLLTEVGIAINKNTVPGDKSPLFPSGIRIGSPAMTTRGCKEQDFIEIMNLIERTSQLAANLGKKTKGSKLKDFKDTLEAEKNNADLLKIKGDVIAFAKRFPVPGGLI